MKYLIEMESAGVRNPEAETLTGVPQHLQRDWRRRGLISAHNAPTRVQYSLWDICHLKVMMILSQAHMGIGPAQFVTKQVALMVVHHLRTSLDTAEFVGVDDLTDDEKHDIMRAQNPGSANDFTLFRIPELPKDDERASYFIASSWEGLGEVAARNGGVAAGLVMDAASIAREIAAASTRPLVTYRLSPQGDMA